MPSILSLYKLDFLLQDYLATGGMLAASTPAISLMRQSTAAPSPPPISPAGSRAAGNGWQKARDLIIETRMNQVKEYGLTESQMAFYRSALGGLLPTLAPEITGLHDALGTDLSEARTALVRDGGETGEHIAVLLTRSVTSHDDTYLRMIGAYNRANTGGNPVSPL